MDAKTKGLVVMYCAFYITSGLIFNKMTFDLFRPSYISQRTVVEKIDKKHQICEIPVFVTIFMYDLMIILSTMLPKTTVHECKKIYERVGRLSHIAYLTSLSVSFQHFFKCQKIESNC